MKSFSPQDIEVLDILEAHIEKGAHRDRFGPEEKEFTEIKLRELTKVFNDLADQWGYIGLDDERN